MDRAGVRTFGFGLRALRKFPKLIPLVSVLSTTGLGGISFIVYSLATKPDVRLIRSRGPAYEDVLPTECRKLLHVNKALYKPIPELEQLLHVNKALYKPIPELEQLRAEIGHYKP